MSGFGYLCALVLAAVFVWAAAAKLARPAQTAAGLAALGVPAPGVMARGVPAVELVTAALLVGAPPAGGLVALALLGGFSLVIAKAIRAGVTTGCTCFGAASTEPVSPADLGRNVLLATLALAACAAPRPTVPPGAALVPVVAAIVLWFTVVRSRR